MSSPAVAGIAALVLQADPSLTPAEVKELLMSTAREDVYTGVIPAEGSVRWGQGKVNAYRAVQQVLGITAVAELENGELRLWPNPTNDQLNIMLVAPTLNAAVELVDATGRTVLVSPTSGAAQITLDVAGLSPGVYAVHIAGSQRSLRFVKH
jgi:subtilisin family serine protease